MPVIRLKSVVLPAPFGPITLTISPSFTWRSSSDTTFRPPKASDTSRNSSRRFAILSALHDLHAALAEQPVRADDHQRDQDEPQDDEARRLRLGQHHVVPDERREVEGR